MALDLSKLDNSQVLNCGCRLGTKKIEGIGQAFVFNPCHVTCQVAKAVFYLQKEQGRPGYAVLTDD